MTSYTKYERLNNKLDNIIKAHETMLSMICNLEDKVSKYPTQCICYPPVQESRVEATTFSTPKVVQPKPKLQLKRKPAAKTFTARRFPQKTKPKPMVAKKPAKAKKSAVTRKSAPSSVKKSITVKKPVFSKKVNSRMTRAKRTSVINKPTATSRSLLSKGKPKSQPTVSNMKAKVHVTIDKSKPKSLQRTKTKGSKSVSNQRTTKQQPRNNKGQSKISPSEKKLNTRPPSANSTRSVPAPSPKRSRVDDSFDLFTMPKESDFDGPPVKGTRFGGIGLPKRRRKSIFP